MNVANTARGPGDDDKDDPVEITLWQAGEDGGDDAAVGSGMTEREKKKRRAVRASLYTYRNAEGVLYHITINSPLGETYRKLASRDERRQFLAKNGVPDPNTGKGKKRMTLRPA